MDLTIVYNFKFVLLPDIHYFICLNLEKSNNVKNTQILILVAGGNNESVFESNFYATLDRLLLHLPTSFPPTCYSTHESKIFFALIIAG